MQLITPGDARSADAKKRPANKPIDESLGAPSASQVGIAGQSPAQSEASHGSSLLTVDAASSFLNDDSSNEALVVDYDSPKCSPGE